MKSWITRPEIQKMFFISSTGFTNRQARGMWGPAVGSVPNESGKGRHMLAYSMKHVLEVYERELPYIAARAIARGVKAEEFENALDTLGYVEVEPEEVAGTQIIWMIVVEGAARVMTPPEYTDDSPYYDGLPI